MLRLNIGGGGQAPTSNYFALTAGVGSSAVPIEGDPFAPGGTIQMPDAAGPGGSGTATAPVDFDPFATAEQPSEPPNPARQLILDHLGLEDWRPPSLDTMNRQAPYQKSFTQQLKGVARGTNFTPGGLGLEEQPDPSAVPEPGAQRLPFDRETAAMRGEKGWLERTTGLRMPNGPVAWDPLVYTQPGYAGRNAGTAPDLKFTPPESYQPEPPGVPDLSGELDQPYEPGGPKPGILDPNWKPFEKGWKPVDQADIDAARRLINAAPIGTGDQPDKQPSLTNQGKGTVEYDPRSGDVYGGHASAGALAAASAVPLTSSENLRKRIAIYADDLKIPPDRFFMGRDGIVKYVDMKGQTFAVSPSFGGGTWSAPFDKARRAVGAGLSEAGQIVTIGSGLVGGGIGGSGPVGRTLGGAIGAAAFSGGAEILRQLYGNAAAERAGYVRDPRLEKPAGGADVLDIDWLNFGGQVIQNVSFEMLARTLPVLLNGLVPQGLFGTNPYILNRQEIHDLAYILDYDATHGGHILRRAQAAHELGLPLTPADLLQVVDGHGLPAGYAEAHGRLLHSLSQLEATLANRSGAGVGAASWLQNFYRHRSQTAFPQAAERLFDLISPAAKSPKEGFTQFQKAANQIIEGLETSRVNAGLEAGWGKLFERSGNYRAETGPVRDFLKTELGKAAGDTAKQLGEVLGQLEKTTHATLKSTTRKFVEPVTDFEKLHNVRLDIRNRIARLDHPGNTAAESVTLGKLRDTEELLTRQLRESDLYAAGDDAFKAASAAIDDVQGGIVPLLTDNPLFQEKLGQALVTAGPTKIAAARKMFYEHGLKDVWDAHTRAYLEHSLNLTGGRGGTIGGKFFDEVGGNYKLREGLKAMAPDTHIGNLIDEFIGAGRAMDTQASRAAVPPRARVSTSRLTTKNTRDEDIFRTVTHPLGRLMGLLRGPQIRDAWRERRSMRAAVNMTTGAAPSYQNLRQTSVPLAGKTGEALERSIYAAGPLVNEATKWIPRATPEWAIKLGVPALHNPETLEPSAPDLRSLERNKLLQFITGQRP